MSDPLDNELRSRIGKKPAKAAARSVPDNLSDQLTGRRRRRRAVRAAIAVACVAGVATAGSYAVNALTKGDTRVDVDMAEKQPKTKSKATDESPELVDAAISILFPATPHDAKIRSEADYFAKMWAVAECGEPKLIELIGVKPIMEYKIALDTENYAKNGMFGVQSAAPEDHGEFGGAVDCYHVKYPQVIPGGSLGNEPWVLDWFVERREFETTPKTRAVEEQAAACLKEKMGVIPRLDRTNDGGQRGGFLYAVDYAFHDYVRGTEYGTPEYESRRMAFGKAYHECASAYHQKIGEIVAEARKPYVKLSGEEIARCVERLKRSGYTPGATPPKVLPKE